MSSNRFGSGPLFGGRGSAPLMADVQSLRSRSGHVRCLLFGASGVHTVGEDGQTCFCCRDRSVLNVMDSAGNARTIGCPACRPDPNSDCPTVGTFEPIPVAELSADEPRIDVVIRTDGGFTALPLATIDGDCGVCRQTGTIHLWLSWNGEGYDWIEPFPCPSCHPQQWRTEYGEWSEALEAWL
jgi:hypothetical protein